MGDSQKNKEKGGYSQWGKEETELLIDLLVDAIHRNCCDANGLINKFTVEQNCLPVLNEKLGCQKEHKHYLSRIKYLREKNTKTIWIINAAILDLDGILTRKSILLQTRCGTRI